MDNETIKTIAFIIGIIFILTTLFLATSKKAVVYWDSSDLFLTTATWLVWPIVMLIGHILKINSTLEIVLGVVLSVIFLIRTFISCVTHNKSIVVGLLVGILKLFFALIGVFLLIGFVASLKNDEQNGHFNLAGFIIWVVIFGVFRWLAHQLINGPEVYAVKGWALPVKNNIK